MHFLLVAVTLLMGAAVGWSIGANDAANSFYSGDCPESLQAITGKYLCKPVHGLK